LKIEGGERNWEKKRKEEDRKEKVEKNEERKK
jgi:hypothetical protein